MNADLLNRIHELRDLTSVIGLMTWDQETYLPKKGEEGRASQLSTLQGLYHERLVDPRLGEWMETAAQDAALTADQKRMLVVLGKERGRAVKLPGRLVRELAQAQAHALSAWREAREKRDFGVFRPHLEKLVGLRREQADAWGHEGERYDALLEHFEPGMRVKRLVPVLESLRAQLVPVVEQLDARPKLTDVFAGKRFEAEAQWQYTMKLLPAVGFDLGAGRQDKSIHPFTSPHGLADVRLTTRITESTPVPAIFGTIHEAGHGMYEQGFRREDDRTPLAQSPSMGLHESQSRFWENLVGRGRPFWKHFYPGLQAAFPGELKDVSLDAWYAALNRVERSFIRVEADEVTYNLHIVLRTELELGLVRGDLEVADLEGAWNDKVKSMLGLTVTSLLDGVLQDIHWAWGEFGYFPTYTLGNLYSASLLAALRRAKPDLDALLERGELAPVLDWLREHVHRHGYRLDAEALVEKATGRGLTDEDFIAYVKAKYGALYGTAL